METDIEREKLNYQNLGQMLTEATQLLVKIFKFRYKKCTKKEWPEANANGCVVECAENFVEGLAKDVYLQSKPIQQKLLKSGKITEWDLTLLSLILTKVDWGPDPGLVGPKNARQRKKERDRVKNENFKIHQLRHVRNNYAHSSMGRVCDENFFLWRGNAESAMKFLENNLNNFLGSNKTTSKLTRGHRQPVATCGQRSSDPGPSSVAQGCSSSSPLPVNDTSDDESKMENEIEDHFLCEIDSADAGGGAGAGAAADEDEDTSSLDELTEINEEYLKSEDFTLVARGCVHFSQRHFQFTQNGHYQNDHQSPLGLENAIEYLETAADAGNKIALYNLGVLCCHGDQLGVSEDFGRALQLFEEAAKVDEGPISATGLRIAGAAEAQYALGRCYLEGLGVDKDEIAAATWFSLAASAGLDKPESLQNRPLGLILEFQNPLLYIGQEHLPNSKNPTKVNAKKILINEQQIRQRANEAVDGGGGSGGGAAAGGDSNENIFALQMRDWLNNFARGLSAMEDLQNGSGDGSRNPEEETIELSEKGQNLLKREILHCFANCFKILPQIRLSDDCLSVQNEVKFFQILHEILLSPPSLKRRSQLTIENARICQIGMEFWRMGGHFDEKLNFLQESIIKFPKESFFHVNLINLYLDLGNQDAALGVASEAMKMWPENYHFVYQNAKTLFGKWSQNQDGGGGGWEIVMANISKFLTIVPRDHWLVPEAHFVLSYLTLSKKGSIYSQGLEHWRKGLDAEQNLLLCFHGNEDSVLKAGAQSCRNEILASPQRIGMSQNFRLDLQRAFAKEKFRKNWLLGQPSDFKKERIMGHHMRRTIMEDPVYIFFGGQNQNQNFHHDGVVQLLVCDDEWNFEWFYIFCHQNRSHDDDGGGDQNEFDWREKFSFGSIIVIQPDLMVSRSDGDKSGFGVSRPFDPDHDLVLVTIIEAGADRPKCRFCSLGQPTIACGKCGRAFYCGDQCQREDWEILNHELVCQENN